MKTENKGNFGNLGNPARSEAFSAEFDEKCRMEIAGNVGNFETQWERPLFFNDYALPDIPAVLLPSPLKEFAAALSTCLETPEGAAVLCVLSVLSTALQGKFDVAVSKDYHESLNLYLLVAMPPANRKSPILKQCLAPLRDYEIQIKRELEPQIKREKPVLAIAVIIPTHLSNVRLTNREPHINNILRNAANRLFDRPSDKNPKNKTPLIFKENDVRFYYEL